jgi:DNA-binding transcriptional ArsR family regulator
VTTALDPSVIDDDHAGLTSEDERQCYAAISRALADAKRLCVLELLASGERSVSDLSRVASCQVPNMSQHLAVLRAAGLVATRRDGSTVYYRLTDPRILEAYRLIKSVAT